jgi:hypothetical protein
MRIDCSQLLITSSALYCEASMSDRLNIGTDIGQVSPSLSVFTHNAITGLRN